MLSARKMLVIDKTTFSNYFFMEESVLFWCKLQSDLFPIVQLKKHSQLLNKFPISQNATVVFNRKMLPALYLLYSGYTYTAASS